MINSRLKNILLITKPFIALIIWFSLTLFTVLYALLTDIILVREHYINLLFLSGPIILAIFNRPMSHLATFLMLILSIFAAADFSPIGFKIIFNGLWNWQVSPQYLPLLFIFIAVNQKELPDWFDAVFNDKK